MNFCTVPENEYMISMEQTIHLKRGKSHCEEYFQISQNEWQEVALAERKTYS